MRIATAARSVTPLGDHFSIVTNAVELRLWFVTDEILRIRAGFDENFREASYSLVTTAWEDHLDEFMGDRRTRITPAAATLTEEADKYLLQGDKLRVEIEKEPFRICVYDADGDLLHADIVDKGYLSDANNRRIHTSQIESDDHFYGFGEKTGEFNKAEAFMGMSPADAMGYNPTKTDSLYKHIPYYVKLQGSTGKAVGYFYHSTWECDFDLGRTKSNYWHRHSRYRTDGGDIDLFLIAGPQIKDVVRRYTDLTGKSVMLPKAALGYLGSSMYYPELAKDADQAIVGFIDTTKSYDIPVDGFQLSSGYCQYETSAGLKRCFFTWNEDRFPDPKRFFTQMTERGITVTPNVKPGILTVHPMIDYMRDEKIFVTASDGSQEPAVGTWWGGPGNFVDYTNPHAREVWKKLLTEHVLDEGTTSVWNDNCEYESLVDKDAKVQYDGVEGGATIGQLKAVMSNIMCQVTVDAIAERFPNQRPYIVCRSGHAGIQRLAQTWAGDNLTHWDSLKYNIATVLGMSLSGVANQGADICGFYGNAPEEELMVRWIQNGIFQPRFSIHSVNQDNTVTEPWMYSAQTDRIRDAINLRYRMFPYLYSLMARANAQGDPIMAPMCYAFQNDPVAWDEGVNFMFGDSILVANVVEKGATTREIYLPAGVKWYDFWTREEYEGGQTISVAVTLDSIPMFVPSGAIIPMATNQMTNFTTQNPTGWTVVISPDVDAEFVVTEDDGTTFDYLNGAQRKTTIAVTAGERVNVDITHTGDFPTTVENIVLDVIARRGAPFWVQLDGKEIPHFLDRRVFEATDFGWYYSQTKKSVLVKYPNTGEDHRVVISFEPFDMIGM